MLLVLILVGAILGSAISGGGANQPLGILTGIAVGFIIGKLLALQNRVKELESKAARTPEPPQPVAEKQPGHSGAASERIPSAESSQRVTTDEPAIAVPLETQLSAPSEIPSTGPGSTLPQRPGPLDVILGKIKDWFLAGNVPVKVGVIVTFVGVAFLLKYAVDHELLVVPLKLRLLLVAVAGAVMTLMGWRMRHKMRIYSLSLQGGGLGIIFLTIFAALRVWQLLPASLSFAFLVALALLTAILSVLQNARALAVLGITGGFLAPILTSTGAGNHVVLFSYYLVLNLGILFIAYFRAWRELNLLGFVFTFVIGSFWGYQYYRPSYFSSTEPFLVATFFLYQLVAILFALRLPKPKRGFVDGTLVFGTPIICFALQAGLLRDTEYGLAISAVIAALFYTVGSVSLYRNQGPQVRMLVESYLALAAVFFIVAVPLAFDARWTSAAWALQGAALVWVGGRQARKLAALSGSVLIIFSGAAFALDGWPSHEGIPVLNANMLGGVLISLSALFSSRRLDGPGGKALGRGFPILSFLLFAWGVLWWFGSGYAEIEEYAGSFDQELHLFTVFFVASMLMAMQLGSRMGWDKARRLTLLLLPGLYVLMIRAWNRHQHFLIGLGGLAWPLAWLAQAWVLRNLDRHGDRLAVLWHFLTVLLLAASLSIEANWQINRFSSEAWGLAAAATVPGLLAWLIWRGSETPAWPVPVHPQVFLGTSFLLVSAQVILLCWFAVALPGDPRPMPYLPLLNPFGIGLLLAAVIAREALLQLKRIPDKDGLLFGVLDMSLFRALLGVGFFILTTAALVRAVHHYTGVPWKYDALFDSVVVQTTLSIYWGILGFSGMIWGAKDKHRRIWLAGAGFMALVVIKLFVVDLGNTGTVARIVSFIGIGALLLVVGYFAPAPPRMAVGPD